MNGFIQEPLKNLVARSTLAPLRIPGVQVEDHLEQLVRLQVASFTVRFDSVTLNRTRVG